MPGKLSAAMSPSVDPNRAPRPSELLGTQVRHGRNHGETTTTRPPRLFPWASIEAPSTTGYAATPASPGPTNRNVRFLRADHSVIGGEYTSDHSPCFGFISVLESVRILRPAAKDMLQIGLGIGSLPSALKPYGIKMDVVEIDPAVVRLARDYFAFSPTGDVHIADARSFLRETNRRYDAIVHDTFTGGTTPEHLLSMEVVQRIRELLRPGAGLIRITIDEASSRMTFLGNASKEPPGGLQPSQTSSTFCVKVGQTSHRAQPSCDRSSMPSSAAPQLTGWPHDPGDPGSAHPRPWPHDPDNPGGPIPLVSTAGPRWGESRCRAAVGSNHVWCPCARHARLL